MADLFRHGWARIAICLALLAQAIAPAAFAATAPARLDAGVFFCAPSGAAAAESRAAVEDLVSSLGDEEDAPSWPAEHCAACTLTGGAPLPGQIDIAPPVFAFAAQSTPALGRQHPDKPVGPPLGQRGPPLFR